MKWLGICTSTHSNISIASEEGTFGVPFETLIERTSVESNLGAGPSRLRIPSFIEDSLSVLKQMGKYLS
jgi:hypothetical protein